MAKHVSFEDALQHVDVQALLAVARNDTKSLAKLQFHPRVLVDELKNVPKDLETLLKFLREKEKMPGSGSYFFTGIQDNVTFDLYKKYEVDDCNLHRDCVTPEQWDYLLKIGFISAETHKGEEEEAEGEPATK